MSDITQLSDAELERLLAQEEQPQTASVSDLTDAELAQMLGASGGGDLIEEMHPKLTFMDRLVVKNLSNDQQAAMKYLQQKHPKLQIGTTSDGRIKAKESNEADWRVLDPSGLDLQDVTDVAYDLGAGIIEGAAAAGAGVAAAPMSFGLASPLAAMTAGGATAATLEGLRQQFGKFAGLDQQISPKDIAITGAIGAVMPGLVGTGATAKQIAKAGIADTTQRGLLRRTADWTLPKIGSRMSGATEKSIQTYMKRYKEVMDIERKGITSVATKTANQLADTLKTVERSEWKKFQSAIENAPERIDVTDAKQSLLARHNELVASGIPEAVKYAKKIRKEMRSIFPKPIKQKTHPITGEIIEVPARPVEPMKALRIKRYMDDIGRFGSKKKPKNMLVGGLEGLPQDRRDTARAAIEGSRILNSQIEDIAEKYGGLAAKENYMNATNIRKEIAPHFKDPQTTFNTMRNIGRPAKQMLGEKLEYIDEMYPGSNALSNANILEAVSYFAKPSGSPLSSMGTTSTSRTIPAAAAGGGLGYILGAQTKMPGWAGFGALLGTATGATLGSPAMMRGYMNTGRVSGKVATKLRDLPGRPLQGLPMSTWHMMYSGGKE